MARFSDIIRSKAKRIGAIKPLESVKQEDGVRLSDSWFFKSRNQDTYPAKKVSTRKTTTPELSSFYRTFINRARETGQWAKNDMRISTAPVLTDLHAIIERDLIDSLYEYAMSVENDNDEILSHTVDVTFTSLKIGKGMNYDMRMMLRLGLAAFLENIGMYKIPENILSFDGKWSSDEVQIIRKHPETGYYLLRSLGDRYAWLAETALSIHERGDGSGYPSGLKQDEIPELSAIIGLADSYCAMIRNRSYRKRFIQTDAVKTIIETDRNKYPSRIVKIFLDQISLFPVNSYVKLNNGSIGRVFSTNRRHPLSPAVEILYDGEGHKLRDTQQVFLTDDPLLNIESSIDPEDLAD
ncbi:MAG: HD domain-containing protein [Deltaproteobacteria bacterium]|nr:HD domain-containing protein [Deltaproteobacteria bacterium]